MYPYSLTKGALTALTTTTPCHASQTRGQTLQEIAANAIYLGLDLGRSG